GRNFLPGEDAHGAPPVLLLSHGFWQRAFAGDPSIVGQTFEMNDKPHIVVGVLPPLPPYPDDNDVYMPTSACPFRGDEKTESNRKARMSKVIGRLRDGVDLSQARTELAALAERMRLAHPSDYSDDSILRWNPLPVREELTLGWHLRLWLLLGVAVCVLLI